MLDSPWNDAEVAARQRALNDQELAGVWPDHFRAYARAIRGCAPTSMLEVGCGNGIGRAVLDASGVQYGRYVGADISAHALAHAAERYPGGAWVHVTPHVAYRARGFDLVADTACLMHATDWEWHLQQLCAAARFWVVLHRIPIGAVTEAFTVDGTFPATRFAVADIEREMRANRFAAATEWPPGVGYTTMVYGRVT